MFKLSFIKKDNKTSVGIKKHRSINCFEINLDSGYNIYDFKIAMEEILENKLKEALGDKYQELEDKDEALTLANKYNKALQLGLFEEFEDTINNIYEQNRRK